MKNLSANIVLKTQSLWPFFKKSIKSDLGVLVGSTAIGQLFLVCAIPVLTRLYDPSVYGYYGLFFSYVSVVSVLLSLRYDVSIIAAKDELEASALLVLSSILLVILAPFLSFIYWLFIYFNFFKFGALPALSVIAVFVGLIVIGGSQILRFYFLRDKHCKLIGKTVLLQNGSRSFLQICLGLVNMKWGLIFGDVFGRAIGTIKMGREGIKEIRRFNFADIKKEIPHIAFKNKAFPFFSLPSSVIDVLACMLPVPIIMNCYGAKEAGLFLLVTRVLNLPASLLTRNIADIFQTNFAEFSRVKPHALKKLFFKTFYRLVSFAVPFAILVVIFAPMSFSLLFGKKWEHSGLLAVYVAPWVAAQFIVSPLSRLVFVIGGLSWKLMYDFLALFAILSGFIMGKFLGLDFINTIGLVSVLNVITYFCYFGLLYFVILKYEKKQHYC